MVNVVGTVNAELLFVPPCLITPEVLNEFQKSENGCDIDSICTVQLFAGEFIIPLKFQENGLMFTPSFSLLPL